MLAHCVVKNSNNRSSFPHTCLSEGCQHPSITQAQTQNYPWSSPSLTPTKQPIAENSASHLHCHPPRPQVHTAVISSARPAPWPPSTCPHPHFGQPPVGSRQSSRSDLFKMQI